MATASSKKERIKRQRRRRRQAVGVLVFVLCVIGAATIVLGTVGWVQDTFFAQSGETGDFAETIAPLVALDPTPFASIEDANQDTLLEAAIWGTLSGEDNSKYARTADDRIILPAVDVDIYLSRMYGPDFKTEHRTFTDLDLEFTYDEATKSYTVPVTSQSGSYIPRIDNVTTSGNTKILLVAYTEASASTTDIILDEDAVTVTKYMEYIMLRSSEGYYLYSVRTPEQELPAGN